MLTSPCCCFFIFVGLEQVIAFLEHHIPTRSLNMILSKVHDANYHQLLS